MADTVVLMHVPKIEGSATLVGTDPGVDGSHKGWIPIDSCSFAMSKESTAIDRDAEADEEGAAARTRVQPMSVKRRADGTTAQLLMWLAIKDEEDPDRVREKVLIDYCAPSGKYYLRYELLGVELVSSSIGFSDDDLSETLTFTYRKISVMQRPIDEKGEVSVKGGGTAEYTVYEDPA